MNDADMVRMVNQIAAYYRSYPHEEAVEGIAGHLRSFWDPRMRAKLSAHLEAGGEGLDDLALAGAKAAFMAPAG
jgi:formate dehydrogenase subunit delta